MVIYFLEGNRLGFVKAKFPVRWTLSEWGQNNKELDHSFHFVASPPKTHSLNHQAVQGRSLLQIVHIPKTSFGFYSNVNLQRHSEGAYTHIKTIMRRMGGHKKRLFLLNILFYSYSVGGKKKTLIVQWENPRVQLRIEIISSCCPRDWSLKRAMLDC